MGSGIQTSGTVRRARKRGQRKPLAEINVTPFVDVMLVLLIIFMVTAPLLTTGVDVDLPESTASTNVQDSDAEPLTVSVGQDGRVFLQDSETSLEEIGPKLKAIAEAGARQVIYVRGDARVNYGVLMQVMGKISAAGFQHISLVTNVEDGK